LRYHGISPREGYRTVAFFKMVYGHCLSID
jgi:hypothetical protein